ncbi:hypothetical protein ABW20_dc0102649 [Dactylellina cionopaga]|nr:hypothetical protein ABW20_dc0102649 [Dactylellina cionopaga]
MCYSLKTFSCGHFARAYPHQSCKCTIRCVGEQRQPQTCGQWFCDKKPYYSDGSCEKDHITHVGSGHYFHPEYGRRPGPRPGQRLRGFRQSRRGAGGAAPIPIPYPYTIPLPPLPAGAIPPAGEIEIAVPVGRETDAFDQLNGLLSGLYHDGTSGEVDPMTIPRTVDRFDVREAIMEMLMHMAPPRTRSGNRAAVMARPSRRSRWEPPIGPPPDAPLPTLSAIRDITRATARPAARHIPRETGGDFDDV